MIELWINGNKADIGRDIPVQFTYQADGLDAPAAVKNSFSLPLTLKGTPVNDAIFNYSYRTDRRTAISSFNALTKTPFQLFNERHEVIESGYVRLDNIVRVGERHEYRITLYGGLGSFLYNLAYNENGDKRTLADLRYLNTANSATELDFIISAQAVADAWATDQSGEPNTLWRVLNFAPTYGGIPGNGFDAKHAIATAADCGLKTSASDGSTSYSAKNGKTLVTLPDSMTEWQVKDLRSYLQRPVLSVWAMLKAMADPRNNGGYTVDIDAMQNDIYAHTWLTLPTIPSLGTFKKDANLTLTASTPLTTLSPIATVTPAVTLDAGAKVTADFVMKLKGVFASATAAYSLYYKPNNKENYQMAICLQMVAYNAADEIVGYSNAALLYNNDLYYGEKNPALFAKECGFNTHGMDVIGYNNPSVSSSSTTRTLSPDIAFSISASGVSYYKVECVCKHIYSKLENVSYAYDRWMLYPIDESPRFGLYQGSTFVRASRIQAQFTSMTGAFSKEDQTRSFAAISKQMLLATEHTPADYLLSFCKMFGYSLICDNVRKHISIVSRANRYEDVIEDISSKVDTSKDITISPFVFNAKWYNFALESVGGAFAKEYEETTGKRYGEMRVNTGYDFDSSTNDVMSSVVFKTAATVLEADRYYNRVTVGGAYRPSMFLNAGCKQTLWAADGKTLDIDVPALPSSAIISHYNVSYPNYDRVNNAKIQLHDADGKAIDGSNILLFWQNNSTAFPSSTRYTSFKLTDDTADMNDMNGGKPCWILDGGTYVDVPNFSTYRRVRGGEVDAVDFGIPTEVALVGWQFIDVITSYSRWQKFIEDRYNADTKILSCHVRMNMDAASLRRFYWYDNSLWVLNKIINHDVTKDGATQCEFIQVQDKNNYR